MRGTLLALLLLAHPATAADTPAGLWQTPGRADPTPAGTVRLSLRNGLLYGRIESIYDPARRRLRCTACTGDRKDAPFLGLEIIRDLHPESGEWTGGTVLDPDTGHTYRATVRLADPRHLTIRGYLGISLFGATQTWTLADPDTNGLTNPPAIR